MGIRRASLSHYINVGKGLDYLTAELNARIKLGKSESNFPFCSYNPLNGHVLLSNNREIVKEFVVSPRTKKEE